MLVLDKTNFETEVLQGQGYILVDFFGDGCAPCEALMPHVEKFAEKYGDKLKFTKLNTVCSETSVSNAFNALVSNSLLISFSSSKVKEGFPKG
jgi:thiol-disulfide isomerase/thioredoxin